MFCGCSPVLGWVFLCENVGVEQLSLGLIWLKPSKFWANLKWDRLVVNPEMRQCV